MDVREIELMRSLQRKYYGELKKKPKGVYVNAQVLFFYRLCAVFVLGSAIGLLLRALA
jgi:hypothetical protein